MLRLFRPRLTLLAALFAALGSSAAQPSNVSFPAIPPLEENTQAAPTRSPFDGTFFGGTSQPGSSFWPSDPLFAQQSYLRQINVPAMWQQLGTVAPAKAVSATAAPAATNPVTVAVLDTGYTTTPELRGRLVGGYDFVSDPARAGDGTGRDAWAGGVGPLNYHAEMVAHLIGAAADGHGMVGVNPSARIVQVRVADINGEIAVEDLIDGLRWAAGLEVAGTPHNRYPARIINASLFADWLPNNGCDPRVAQAVREVSEAGALVVVGAGNEDRDAGRLSPAGCEGALTVTAAVADAANHYGATGYARAAYANWGPAVALAAPGGDPARPLAASTALNSQGRPLRGGELGVQRRNGTSFAAPLVSGVASLLLAERPELTPAELRDLLVWSAAPWPAGQQHISQQGAGTCDPDPRKSCGSGMLNAAGALDLLRQLYPRN